ncbi:MAG: C40 family peptidase [Hyphomicrobiaceae bacterium]|nr:C40 family peptidase [Hyphomicrobiaceae bacterium]
MAADTPALDRRRNAFRADLAAEALRGRVAAPRYAAGEARQVVDAAVPLREAPDAQARWATQVLFGEHVTLYEECGGWAWVQLAGDGYVGYLPASALSRHIEAPTHWVRALSTWLYARPDFKSPPSLSLSMNAAIGVVAMDAGFARLVDGRFVPAPHIAAQRCHAPDFVAVAERFLGVPYLWGGKTGAGVDCSGLLQLAFHASGRPCPRDSDMQLAEVGERALVGNDLSGLVRGDLVFWPGHVGIMLDPVRLLHANAHHMAVAVEPLGVAAQRIACTGQAIAAVKRLLEPR